LVEAIAHGNTICGGPAYCWQFAAQKPSTGGVHYLLPFWTFTKALRSPPLKR